ncbi:MAG: DUF445 family protein [Oceanococcaceae bacterium]
MSTPATDAARFDVGRLDRYCRLGLILAAGVFGGLDYWVQGSNPWFKSLFVVAVAGLVGYFTNFLAIKMLFQPKRGQVLGWRGLVPKNQAQIAQSLGASVQEQLLSPDIILAYIRERDLIDAATRSAAQWLDANLQRPEVRRAITEKVVALVDQRGRDFIRGGFDLSEQALKRAAGNPEVIASIWQPVREWLLGYLATDGHRAEAARHLQTLVLTNLPQIADWIDTTLEDYLRRRKMAGSLGLGLKNLVSLDRDAISELLRRFAEDENVGRQVMQGLDAVIDGLQRELHTERTQNAVQHNLARGVEHLAGLARQHMLPVAVEKVGEYFNDARNWTTIEELLMQAIGWGKDRALSVLASDEGQLWLRQAIEQLVQQVNVQHLVEQQVMKLDTDELESMVLDNTGGNLTIIQVLGGGLGIIAGTVQVHLAFAIPIAVLLLIVFGAWRLNEWQQDRRARRAT